jgi:hypothetical protein
MFKPPITGGTNYQIWIPGLCVHRRSDKTDVIMDGSKCEECIYDKFLSLSKQKINLINRITE